MLCVQRCDAALQAAWTPYSLGFKAVWWESVSVPDDVEEEEEFRTELRCEQQVQGLGPRPRSGLRDLPTVVYASSLYTNTVAVMLDRVYSDADQCRKTTSLG